MEAEGGGASMSEENGKKVPSPTQNGTSYHGNRDRGRRPSLGLAAAAVEDGGTSRTAPDTSLLLRARFLVGVDPLQGPTDAPVAVLVVREASDRRLLFAIAAAESTALRGDVAPPDCDGGGRRVVGDVAC